MRTLLPAALLLTAALTFAQTEISIAGTVEWEKMEINAAVTLNLSSVGIKLPSGRSQCEALIAAEYLRLMRPHILKLQVDSASTIADLVIRGEWNLLAVENLAREAKTVPPAFTSDLQGMSELYSLTIAGISSALIRHNRPAELPRTLSPAAAPTYTGIIIIASGALPVHGKKSPALPVPCLFPKIWDEDMNLIFERTMLNPAKKAMVHYAPPQRIFSAGPSGLTPELAAVVGEKPLRIFARSVFGISPTDPIISRDDALQIISSEENRSLLREGKVAIILDESVLKDTM